MKFLYKSVTVKVGALSVLCGLYAFAATEELQNRNEQETVVFFFDSGFFFSRATSQSPCLHETLMIAAITNKK